jgi:hypothetical protein
MKSFPPPIAFPFDASYRRVSKSEMRIAACIFNMHRSNAKRGFFLKKANKFALTLQKANKFALKFQKANKFPLTFQKANKFALTFHYNRDYIANTKR